MMALPVWMTLTNTQPQAVLSHERVPTFRLDRLEAAKSLESAQSTGDPGLKARAFEMNERVALASQDSLATQEHIQNALAMIEEFDVPLTAWRVHAAAWELCPNQGEAERHRTIARDTILAIADSFEPDEPLRASLLSAAPIRHMFGSAGRPDIRAIFVTCGWAHNALQ